MNVEINIADKLFPNIFTMITQLISTGVLLYFFKKFLWGPLQTYLGKRAEFIETNINEAKDMNEKAKIHMEESEKLAKASAIEYRDVVEKTKLDATIQSTKIIDEAKETASRRLAQAEKQIESEREKAKQEMRQEMVEIAMEAAKKVVSKEIDHEANRELIDAFVSEVSQ